MRTYFNLKLSILFCSIMLLSSCGNSEKKAEQRPYDGTCLECGKEFYKEQAYAGKAEGYIGKSENGSYCSDYCATKSASPD